MKTLFTYLLLLASVSLGFAQQIGLNGQISIHNSRYRTGEIEYVADASVQAPFAGETSSDNKGNFDLTFTGLEKGSPTPLTIEKAGLEVVNERDILHVVLGRTQPLKVFLAKKGELAQRQTEFYDVSLAAITAKHDELIAALRVGEEESTRTIQELEQQLNREIEHRYEAEDIIREQLEAAKERLPEMAKRLAAVNLDFASTTYRHAYEAYQQGDVQGALALLDDKALADRADGIIAALSSINQDQQDFQLALEAEFEKASQVDESYALKADAYKLIFDYRSAVAVLKKRVSLLEAIKDEEDVELANAYEVLGLCLIELGEYSEALTYQLQSTDIKRQLLPPDNQTLASSYNNLAYAYSFLGKYEQASATVREAIAIYEQKPGTNLIQLASSYSNLSTFYQKQGSFQQALTVQHKALSIKKQALEPMDSGLAISYNNLGGIYLDLGKYEQAEANLEKALIIYDQVLEPNDPKIAMLHNNLAQVYKYLELYNEALAAQQKSIAILEQILETSHPSIAAAYTNLAINYNDVGEHAKALVIQQQSISIFKNTLEPNHPSIATAYNNLAIIYRALRQFDKALASQQEDIRIKEQSLVPDHPGLASSYNNLAITYHALGETEKALISQQNALTIQEQTLEANHPKIATSYSNLANIYRELGQYQQALAAQKKGLAIDLQTLAANHPLIAITYQKLVLTHSALGQYEEAIAAQQQVIMIQEHAPEPNPLSIATSYNDLALMCLEVQQYDLALVSQKKALAIREQHQGPDHIDVAITHYNFFPIYYYQGKLDSAIWYTEKALVILEEKLPEKDPNLQRMRSNLARTYTERGTERSKKGNYLTAIADFERALPLSNDQGELFLQLGLSHYYAQDYKRAIECYDTSYRLGRLDYATYLNNTGLAYAKWGDTDEAHIRFMQLEKIMPDHNLPYRDWGLYYTITGEYNIALDKLEKAIQLGYDNWEWLRTEEHLASLRDHPRFQALLEQAPTQNE